MCGHEKERAAAGHKNESTWSDGGGQIRRINREAVNRRHSGVNCGGQNRRVHREGTFLLNYVVNLGL